MKNKMLSIMGLLLIFGFTVNAVNLKNTNVNTNNQSHVAIEQSSLNLSQEKVTKIIEDDVIISEGSRRNDYNNGTSRATADTMSYCADAGGQFIMSPGEYMVVVYQMPADATIKGVNIPVFEWGDTSDVSADMLEATIWKMNYPNGSDGNPYSTGNVDGGGWAGYYWDGTDNTMPYFATDGFTDYFADTGPCAGATAVPNAQDLVMEKVWPPFDFLHATLSPSTNPAQQDNWIATGDFGGEPAFLQGDWVGILVENQGVDDAVTSGFYYCEGAGIVDPWVFAKFYNGCNGTSGEGGWHIRHWVIDYPLAVELTGDRGPVFESFDALTTTLSTDNRPVEANITDDNPSGETAGVASASISYTTDDSTWTDVAMTMTGGTSEDGTWGATIPGMAAGTVVSYYYEATDVNGNMSSTAAITYSHFAAVHPNLFVNNSHFGDGTADYYYFYGAGALGDFPHDVWSFGDGTAELFANYDAIVDLQGGGPSVCHDIDDLSAWLDMGDKNLIIAGDEWLGACFYGWPAPMDIPVGDFANDYMGLTHYAADINYSASGDQNGVSRLLAVDGDHISGELASFLADSLDLNYDPAYEIGAANWLDGVEGADGSMTSFNAVSGVLDTLGNPAGMDTMATGIYMDHANGNQTAFYGFDVLSTNTSPSYYWIGIQAFGPLPMTLNWMGLIETVGIDESAQLPAELMLNQNYPNPFNPVTNISFALPEMSKVNLTIYNLLGEEVKTLVNSELNAGTHNLVWDGSDAFGSPVASGVYIYQVSTLEHTSSKKMLLLK